MHSFVTIAYVHIRNKKVLLTKPFKHRAFYMPGGKHEEGEDDIATLKREIKEELGVDILPESIKYFGDFIAQAYAKPKGTLVKIICYFGDHVDEPQPHSEIEALRYFSHSEYLNMSEIADAVKLIIKSLKRRRLIE